MSTSEWPRPGDVLGGRYRLDSLARDSRSCLFFHGTEIANGAKISIQILVAETTDESRMRFLAGARRAVSLEGTRVARVRDGGVTKEGYPWVIREGLPEASLAQILAVQKSLPTTLAIDVALEICAALCEAHLKGIVHGDLSAHCVYLLDDSVKVGELGTGEVTSSFSSLDMLLRAPEQIQGAALDVRADVWAVGVLLHTMLSGEAPFGSDSPSTVNLAVVMDDPPSLAGVPDELAEIVEGCLAKQPDARIRSVFALAEKLAPFASKPVLIPTENESTPTIVVADEEYDKLVKAQQRPSISTEIAPSVRDVTVPPKNQPKPRSVTPFVIGAGAALVAFLGAGIAVRHQSNVTLAAAPAHIAVPTVVAAAPPPPGLQVADLPPAAGTATSRAPASSSAATTAPAKKPVTKKPAPAFAVAEPAAPAAEPVAAPAPAPVPPSQPKPEPKVESDDLRRFLDDRR